MSLRSVFSRRAFKSLCTAALVVAATSVGNVQAQSDLSGSYAVTGTNPSGSTYVGTLNISPSKATLSSSVTVYQLAWTIAGDKSVGLGDEVLRFWGKVSC